MQRNAGDFYTQLAYWYDDIFPVSVQQVDFIHRIAEQQRKGKAKRLLDVGCGTGALALTLSILGVKVVGVDLNKYMIEQARLKSETVGSTPEFFVQDMLSLEDNLAGMTFDVISCLGNTLVHLEDPAEIKASLKQFSRLLDQKGSIVIQIVNYDKVLSEKITALPVIEAEGITFERFYEWEEGDPRILFRTLLNTPDTARPIEQETALYPLRKHELEAMLTDLGFGELNWYSSFQKDPLDNSMLPLIVHASR